MLAATLQQTIAPNRATSHLLLEADPQHPASQRVSAVSRRETIQLGVGHDRAY